MKEVNYSVATSMIFPEKHIFAGCMKAMKKNPQMSEWITRGDVTNQVINAFFDHYIAKTKLKMDSKSKGIAWDFNHDEFDIELIIKKKVSDESK